MNREVIVIGGGASGMAAAISAAEQGAQVTLLEKKEQTGKKILVSGNGRCNFSSTALSVRRYHCSDEAFLDRFLTRFPAGRLLARFRDLGLYAAERNGGYYPSSFQASSVNTVLQRALKTLDVSVRSRVNVLSVEKEEDGFIVRSESEVFHAGKVILACGSPAGVSDPKPFTAYDILKRFGLTAAPCFPALARLIGNNGYESLWDGVRIPGIVSFYGRTYEGEIQLTKDGISGIPVFQLAHDVNQALLDGKRPCVMISFLKEPSREELAAYLKEAKTATLTNALSFRDYISALLPKKLAMALFSGSSYEQLPLSALDETHTEEILQRIYAFSYPVQKSAPMKEAQVSAGGLLLSAVNDDFEVRSVPGLFVTGELLDVDGETGGFNLHFAFASGFTAGEKAGRP